MNLFDDLEAEGDTSPDILTTFAQGKDEMNLSEFPFAVIAKRVASGQKTIEVIQEGRDQEGRPIRQEWLVTGSDRFGLPVASDDEVYVALMKLLRDNRFTNRTVNFTIAQLLRIMHSGTSKRDYERVIGAMDRLTGVLIRSQNAFWDHSKHRYVTEAFHLLESYRIVSGGASRQLSEVTFSEFLFTNMQAGYVKNLDIDFYFSLSSALTRRLYRLLDKHRYRAQIYEIELYRLSRKIPLQDQFVSQLRRRLDPAFDEFKTRGFLRSVTYRLNADNNTIVRIEFEAIPALSTTTSISTEATATSNALIAPESCYDKLISSGVSRTVSKELVNAHSVEAIEQQLQYLPFVDGLKNPGGYLRLAIEHGYGPPPRWVEIERKKLAARSSAKSQQQVKPPDPIHEAWDQLDPAEQEALIVEAENTLRSSHEIWRKMRRIPRLQLVAHARHLLASKTDR